MLAKPRQILRLLRAATSDQFQTFGPAVNANTTDAQLFENAARQSESSFYQYFLGGAH